MRWTWWAEQDMEELIESLDITVEQQMMAYEVAEGIAADRGSDVVNSADVYAALEGYEARAASGGESDGGTRAM